MAVLDFKTLQALYSSMKEVSKNKVDVNRDMSKYKTLIDYDELMDRFKNNCCGRCDMCGNWTKDGCTHLVNATKIYMSDDYKHLVQPEWILCKDRLPRMEDIKENNGQFIVSDGVRVYAEYFNWNSMEFGEPTMDCFRRDYAVIKWMPLPKA